MLAPIIKSAMMNTKAYAGGTYFLKDGLHPCSYLELRTVELELQNIPFPESLVKKADQPLQCVQRLAESFQVPFQWYHHQEMVDSNVFVPTEIRDFAVRQLRLQFTATVCVNWSTTVSF